MVPSSDCVDLIKLFEGFYADAYKDPVKIVTIGYGSIMWKDGKKIEMGQKISHEAAVDLLMWEVTNKSVAIDKLVQPYRVNQHQFDALVCFAYNVGYGALAGSTLFKKLKVNKDDPTIKDEFLKWNKAGGVVLKGLTRRREAEAALYFKSPSDKGV
jgi:lysozyme